MPIKLKSLMNAIEKHAPLNLAEGWDNVGLIIGNPNSNIERILVCLDVTEDVVEEAICNRAELIISHHPFLFKSLKKINGENDKDILIYKIIKNNLNIYSAHTNLDFADFGLNYFLAKKLKLNNIKNLLNLNSKNLYKLSVFVPADSLDKVRNALGKAGAGFIGNYSNCSFTSSGTGTFMPLDNSNPYIGKKGLLEQVNEYKIETVVEEDNLSNVLEEMIKVHPYEEVAYDVYLLKNVGKQTGYGKFGELDKKITFENFTKCVKKCLKLDGARIIGSMEKEIAKVGVFSGTFDEGIVDKISNRIDVLVTGDVKYHVAQSLEKSGICVIDAGHYSTEIIVKELVADLIEKEFENIKVIKSSVEKDVFKYI